MNLSKSIKSNPLAYIAMKSKANPKKISMYKKIYLRIKNLELIDKKLIAGGDSVGIRFPIHEIARKFINECNVPIAAPSANKFSTDFFCRTGSGAAKKIF